MEEILLVDGVTYYSLLKVRGIEFRAVYFLLTQALT